MINKNLDTQLPEGCPQLLVFTDLDGTLLDHYTYSYAPAMPAVRYLKSINAPLILNSSKTAAEMSQLHKELELDTPFVVENGGTIVYPDGTSQHLGANYQQLRSELQHVRNNSVFQFEGFGDLSDQQIADYTGLPLDRAKLAKQRQSSEPIKWLDSAERLEAFKKQLSERGIQLLKGGRFYHVMGQVDKKVAVDRLKQEYQEKYPQYDWVTIALGDGPNDKRMLEAVDYPVVIKPAKGNPLQLEAKHNAIYTQAQGPAGWLEAMQALIKRLHDQEIHCG